MLEMGKILIIFGGTLILLGVILIFASLPLLIFYNFNSYFINFLPFEKERQEMVSYLIKTLLNPIEIYYKLTLVSGVVLLGIGYFISTHKARKG